MKNMVFALAVLIISSINSYASQNDCESEIIICKADNVLVIWDDGSKGVYQVLATSNNHSNIKVREDSWIMGGETWVKSTKVRKVVYSKDGISTGQYVQVKYNDGSGGSYKVSSLAGEYVEISSNHSSSDRWLHRRHIQAHD
jgi:hypothetical protein